MLLTVPSSHGAPGDSTIEVRFGVARAAPGREKLGTLVILTGGPGTSGIDLAPGWLEILPPVVTDRYDIVLFEQRGVGESASIACPDAEGAGDEWLPNPGAGTGPAIAAASDWVAACLREADLDAEMLDRYATQEAAADLDAYLDHVGAGQVVLFGESYGTQLALAYATHRPERVKAMILDSAVDTRRSAVSRLVEQTSAFGGVLDLTLEACAEDAACADDFAGGDPIAGWNAIASRLTSGELQVQLQARNGGTASAPITHASLVRTAGAMLYTEWERSMLLRVLAAGSHGDFAPLARLDAVLAGRDPETGEAFPFVENSFASYFAIECQDFDPGTVESELAEITSGFESLMDEGSRLASLLFDALPCVSGMSGSRGAEELVDRLPDVPMLILAATADPATPYAWGQSLADSARNAHLITTEGGSHGNYGWGVPCIDDPVRDLLTLGDLPDGKETLCEGVIIAPYAPLALPGPDSYASPLDAMLAVETELAYLPDYVYWDGSNRRLGCPQGGWLQMTVGIHGDQFDLEDCRLLAEWPMSGTVIFSGDFETEMEVDVPEGELVFTVDDQGSTSLTGTLDGVSVNLSR